MNHEIWYDSMEDDAIVVAVFNVGREIFAGFWSSFRVELKLDGPGIGFKSDSCFAHRRSVLRRALGSGKEKKG